MSGGLTHLESAVEGVADVPGDVGRALALMRELDAHTQALLAAVSGDALLLAAMAEGGAAAAAAETRAERAVAVADTAAEDDDDDDRMDTDLVRQAAGLVGRADVQQRLQAALAECRMFAAEKVALARQSYETVDAHIRRLDAEIAALSDQLSAAAADTAAGSSADFDDDASSYGGQPPVELDMPVDPNEPLYCICQRVSFGEMIACDNTRCPIGWFHMECVHLTAPPKGTWYCDSCKSKKH